MFAILFRASARPGKRQGLPEDHDYLAPGRSETRLHLEADGGGMSHSGIREAQHVSLGISVIVTPAVQLPPERRFITANSNERSSFPIESLGGRSTSIISVILSVLH
jgi:hypothetical protein